MININNAGNNSLYIHSSDMTRGAGTTVTLPKDIDALNNWSLRRSYKSPLTPPTRSVFVLALGSHLYPTRDIPRIRSRRLLGISVASKSVHNF